MQELRLPQSRRIILLILRFALVLAWIAVACSPYFINPHFFDALQFHTFSLQLNHYRVAYAQVMMLSASELLAISLLFGLLKCFQLKRSTGGFSIVNFTLKILSCLLVTVYFVIIIASWYLFHLKGIFLRWSDLSLLQYFGDLSNLIYELTEQDLWTGLKLIAAAILITVALYRFSPQRTELGAAYLHIIALCVLLLSSLLLAKLTDHASNITKRRELRFLLANFLAPQMTLFSSILYPGDDPDSFKQVQPELKASYSIEQYRKNISVQWKPNKNIVVFVVEALRHDALSAAGGDSRIMPTVNALAQNGISIEHAYAQAPETESSLGAIISGLYPLKFPARNLNFDLGFSFVRIYDLLSDLGYRTAYLTAEWSGSQRFTRSGKLNLYADPRSENYNDGDSWQPSYQLEGDRSRSMYGLDQSSVNLLKRFIGQDDQRPFFAIIYLYSSHFPYLLDPSQPEIFKPSSLKHVPSFFSYSSDIATTIKNRYWNTLHQVDRFIAETQEHLKQLGKLNDTTLIITGDHGELFGEHGDVGHASKLHEEVLRVPLVISNTMGLVLRDQGQTAVGHLDIAPTILEILGLPPHDNYQGQSALVHEHESGIPAGYARPIFSSVQMLTFEDALILYPFKYVINHRGESDRLFNLDQDPQEGDNLVSKKVELAQALKQILQNFRNEQLSYYALPTAKRQQYFPPQPPKLLKIPE